MVRLIFLVVVAAAATLAVSVDGHTNMLVPVPKFPDNFYNGNSPMGRINGDAFASASAIASYQGVNKIAKVMEGYKTLRELITSNVNLTTIDGLKGTKECGLTITTGAKQPMPDAVDFPWGHPGPCEVWCDNTRIFYNGDCQGNNVGKVPVDKAKCSGVSIIQAMYVGVHVSNWEVYANCAPIEGGTQTDPATLFKSDASGSGAAGATSGGSSGAAGDADGSGSSNATTSAPASTPTTTTVAPTTTAPASGSKKPNCKRRRA